MPELPDIELYIGALKPRVVGAELRNVRIANPFLLRTFEPPLSEVFNRTVNEIRRLGKRIVFYLEDEYFLILHLMVAGRLQWKDQSAKMPKKFGLAAFDFSTGTVILTEAGTTRRASLHVIRSEVELRDYDPGGIEVLDSGLRRFEQRLRLRNHTLKRALCDPTMFSGIGNAYSDEILHAARLSPFKQTRGLTSEEVLRLYDAVRSTLESWVDRLRQETGEGFPKKVTAFRPDMAVHGKYGEPCPACETRIQKVVYASNETNYCPTCQTGGRVLRDRALSRLLKSDWPESIEELEGLAGRRTNL